MRWVAQLGQFDFDIKFRSGTKNKAADALSRNPVEEIHVTLQEITHTTQVPADFESILQCITLEGTQVDDAASLTTLPQISKQEMSKRQSQDPCLGKLLQYYRVGAKPTRNLIRRENTEVRKLLNQWDNLVFMDEVLYRKVTIDKDEVHQLLLPRSLRKDVIQSLHNDTGRTSLLQF